MNKAMLIGNLVADPEVREMSSGIKNATFRIGVQRTFKNQNGIYDSDFLSIVCWGLTADFVGNYLRKGNRVAVEGRIQTRSYDAQDGTKRYVTEIIADHVENLTPRQNGSETPVNTARFEEISTDGLPF